MNAPHNAESDAPVLSTEQRELLGSSDARMQGYYIGFDRTGVVEIDRILSALAWAGKAYHHTEGWNDDLDWDYGPFPKGTTVNDLIQKAANDAALTVEKHKDSLFKRGERWKAREAKAREEGLALAEGLLRKVMDYWDGRPLKLHGEHIWADLVDVLNAITPAESGGSDD